MVDSAEAKDKIEHSILLHLVTDGNEVVEATGIAGKMKVACTKYICRFSLRAAKSTSHGFTT